MTNWIIFGLAMVGAVCLFGFLTLVAGAVLASYRQGTLIQVRKEGADE